MNPDFANSLLKLETKAALGIATAEEEQKLVEYKTGATLEVLHNLKWFRRDFLSIKEQYFTDLTK